MLLLDFSDPVLLSSGEEYTVFVASFTIAACMVILIVLYLDLHRGVFGCRCHNLVSLLQFSVDVHFACCSTSDCLFFQILYIFLLLMCLWLAAGCVQTWITATHKNDGRRYVGMRATAAVSGHQKEPSFLGTWGLMKLLILEILANLGSQWI